MSKEAMKRVMAEAKRDERHRTNAETRYWCDQYKQIATEAIRALEEALAKQELLFEVDGEMLTLNQIAGVELFNFQEATGCNTAEEFKAKQEQEYPFGVYNAEDLDKAWKSGYDNCKAQAVWTLEDVKNAWKRGYASAKKECRAKEAKENP